MNRKALIFGGAVLAAAAVGVGCYWPFRAREPVLTLPGTVEVQEVRPASKVGGRVKQVLVAESDRVAAGQPLVVLDVPELEAQRDQVVHRLAVARAALARAEAGARPEEKAAARAAAQAAEARWQRLKAGPRTEEVEHARGELAAAVAELERGEREWQREQRILRAASTEANYDTARAASLRLAGMAQAARARLDMLEAGTRAEEVAEAAAELARARANAELLEAGTRIEDKAQASAAVAELEARLRELEANVREAVVRAAEPAVVEVVAVRAGDTVAPNQPVVRLLRADDVWVKAYVSEVDLGRVRLGQEVAVTNDAYRGRRFEGRIAAIATASEFTPRNVQSLDERRHQVFGIKVRVADPDGVFKSGMAAEVKVPLQ